MPKKPRQELKLKSVQITPSQQDMIDTLVEKWGFVSESEVFRQALSFFYRKHEPEYLKPTPTQQEKILELSKKEELEKMPNDVYAREIVKAVLVKDANKKIWAVANTIANNLKVLPVEDLKAHYDEFPDLLTLQLDVVKTKPIEPLLKSQAYQRDLLNAGVVFPIEIVE